MESLTGAKYTQMEYLWARLRGIFELNWQALKSKMNYQTTELK